MPRKATQVRATKPVPKPKVRKDPMLEYREMIGETKYAKAKSLNDEDLMSNIRARVSSSSLALDELTGGGFPCGRITEMWADEGVGKSTILAQSMAQLQREATEKVPTLASLVDNEHTADKTYWGTLGVDLKRLNVVEFIRNEQSLENFFEIVSKTADWAEKRMPKGRVLIGLDSLGTTSADDEIKETLKKGVGESHAAKPAKAIRSGLRHATPHLSGTRVAVVILNHTYTKVGHMGYGPPPKVPYGGQGMAFYSTLRLRLYRLGRLEDSSGVVIGNKVGVSIVKNKAGATWDRTAEIAILHGRGIDNVYTVFEDLKQRGLIVTGGQGWYGMQIAGDEPLRWQGGFLGLGQLTQQHPDLFPKLVSVYKGFRVNAPVIEPPMIDVPVGAIDAEPEEEATDAAV